MNDEITRRKLLKWGAITGIAVVADKIFYNGDLIFGGKANAALPPDTT